MVDMTDDEKAALADVYEKAAEYLEDKGWCPNLGEAYGPGCVDQAIWIAENQIGVNVPGYKYGRGIGFAVEALELRDSHYWTGMEASTLGRWNDDPDRTADEVINTLHALANKLR